MARQYITKATINGLFKARKEARPYSRKLSACTWLLRFVASYAGICEDLIDYFVMGDKELRQEIIDKKMDNVIEGMVIPSFLLREGKPFGDRLDLIYISMTHGLNTMTCQDFNDLAKFAINLEN